MAMILLAMLLVQDEADRVLRDLASESYEVREAATNELFAMGVDRAAPILARAVVSRDFEVRARALHVKNSYERPQVLRSSDPSSSFGVTSMVVIVVSAEGPAPSVPPAAPVRIPQHDEKR